LSNSEEMKESFRDLTKQQADQAAEHRREINEIRMLQKQLNERVQEDHQQAERRRPNVNGVSEEDMASALEVGIDLSVSMLVISKSEKHLGEAFSLISYPLPPTGKNKFVRSILDDLFSKRQQADHSFDGNSGKLGHFDADSINKLKGIKKQKSKVIYYIR